MPTSSAAQTLASARPRVSWKWPHQNLSPAIRRAAWNSSRTALGLGVADGVGDADAVGAGVEQRLHAAQDLGRFHFALQRAAEGGADAAFEQRFRSCGIARGADPREFGDHLVGCLAQVRQAVRVAGRERHQQHVDLAFDRALGAPKVGHEHRDDEAGQRLRERHQLDRVGELRQQPCRHERADLDLALAGRVGVADPFELALGGERRGDALQAVAQADLANDRARWKRVHVAVSCLVPVLRIR